MKQHAAAVPFSRPQHGSMPTPRRLLRLLTVTVCLSFAQPFAAVAQTNTPALLPPAAQEALNKGIIAAKVPDYLLAIRFFEDARKLAPQAPVVYLNIGLAESKIPSRELRAMAWFGAYLAAYPDAPNAAAVKEQIAVLDVKSQSNLSRLIKTVQDAAGQTTGPHIHGSLARVAKLYAKSGDITAALATAELIQGEYTEHAKISAHLAIAESQARSGDTTGAQRLLVAAEKIADLLRGYSKADRLIEIANAQIKAGDIAGAQKSLVAGQRATDLNDHAGVKIRQLAKIAETQARSGDIMGAQKTFAFALTTADLITNDPKEKLSAQLSIAQAQVTVAVAQVQSGDIPGAQKTADLIQEVGWKSVAQKDVAVAQARSGDIAGAQKTSDSIQRADYKSLAQIAIAKAQAKAGITSTPNSTRPSTSGTQPQIQPAITITDWLKRLDDNIEGNDCPLNTGPFLDLGGFLRSLPTVFPSIPPAAARALSAAALETLYGKSRPPSENPLLFFDSLYETAETIVRARNVITGMLKQQAQR